MVDEQLLDRIRKLHAKATSSAQLGPDYEEEAKTFMAAVQQLLLKHDLTMSDVEYQASLKTDPVKMHMFDPAQFGLKGSKRVVLWQLALAHAVAEAHSCGIIVLQGNALLLVGRREHRAVAEFMLIYLLRLVDQAADKAYVRHFYEMKRQGDVTQARGYRHAFVTGMVHRIVERYEELEKAGYGLSQADRKVAMIRLSTEKGLVKAFVDNLREKGHTEDAKAPSGRDVRNLAGLAEGIAEGNSVPLDHKAMQAGQPTKPALTQGQRLLPSTVQ